MRWIRPNARWRMTGEDLSFVGRVLGDGPREAAAVESLFADPASRDALLDDPRLASALLSERACLPVSSALFFYVLVRRRLRSAGLDSREVADYVASLLTDFARTESLAFRVRQRAVPVSGFVELMEALSRADGVTAFWLRVHIGNLALLLTGIFEAWLRRRVERRGAPGPDWYAGLGEAHYRQACHHPLAEEYELAEVLELLGSRFPDTRRALSGLAREVWSGREAGEGTRN